MLIRSVEVSGLVVTVNVWHADPEYPKSHTYATRKEALDVAFKLAGWGSSHTGKTEVQRAGQ